MSIGHTSSSGKSKFVSESGDVNVGIPQGSILGPLFFILYVNDLVNVAPNVHFTIYADDTSIVVSNKSQEALHANVNCELERLHEWFGSNDLYVNASKTQALLFQSRQRPAQKTPNLIIDSVPVVFDEDARFLGINIDRYLSWKPHCQSLCAKLNSLSYQFRMLYTVLTTQQLLNLYHAQVGSRLSYGVCFWGGSSLAADILICQKKILRMIKNVPSTYSCRELFKIYNILTVTSLFIFELCIYVFVNKDKFSKNSTHHNFNTRQRSDFCIPLTKLNITKNAPNVLGLKLFNKLPVDLKNAMTLSSFKNGLKKLLIGKTIYSLSEFYGT